MSFSGEFDPGPEKEARLGRENTERLQRRRRVRDESEALRRSVDPVVDELDGLLSALGQDALRESDLTLVTLKSWSAQLDRPARREVSAELSDVWSGRIGAWDIATKHEDGALGVVVEAKWIPTDKSHELVWDVVKVASALASRRASAGFLVVGLSDGELRRKDRPQELLRGGTWNLVDLLTRHAASWRWSAGGSKPRPLTVPETISTEVVADVPLEASTGGGWRLVLLEVRADGQQPFVEPN